MALQSQAMLFLQVGREHSISSCGEGEINEYIKRTNPMVNSRVPLVISYVNKRIN